MSSAAALELRRRADRLARGNSGTWRSFLSGFMGGGGAEEAAEAYTSAANMYKQDREFVAAAECFVEAAQQYEKIDDWHSQAANWSEAGAMIKRFDKEKAEEAYEKASKIYCLQGRWGMGGKVLRGIAEMYEEVGNGRKASEYYKKAADAFDMDEYSKSVFTQCLLKYADYISRNGKSGSGDDEGIDEAIEIYEKEGEKALRNALIQYGAKEYFLKAGILRLCCQDIVSAKIACERYVEMDVRFGPSREGKLLHSLVDAMEQQDPDSLTSSIEEYDRITKLDSWKIHFLYRLKKHMLDDDDNNFLVGEDGNVDLS